MTLPRRAEAPPSGIPTWARVGAKVVCLDAATYGGEWRGLAPKVGGTYVIAALTGLSPGGRQQARLTDCTGTPLYSGGRVWLARFRPLITKSQDEDIAEFRKLLTGQPVRESEPVQ